jgi:hypothetical protein
MVARVERAAVGRVAPGTIITVKHVKKALGIPSGDKSATAFVSRALQELERRGVLDEAPRNGVRKYKTRGVSREEGQV